jgi:16S rRNA (guanine527-N7)-methyltransferase
MELIEKYFPELSTLQKKQFSKLGVLYGSWNEMINVVSRKDIDNLYLHHVLHSLGIAAFLDFEKGSSVLDIGTGGGFPGIPLAIIFPECRFHLVDSIGKKIKVVRAVAEAIELKNLTADVTRGEALKGKYDVVVSRSVASLSQLFAWTEPLLNENSSKKVKGLLALKGGDLEAEIDNLLELYPYLQVDTFHLNEVFEESFFEEKKLLWVQ